MLYSSPEGYRKELESLTGWLQALKEDFGRRGIVSGADHAVLDRVQREKDDLAAKLSDAERNGNWDLIKTEFAGAWNLFVSDLSSLEWRMQDVENIKQRKV